jgi:two-component system, NarL family, sensor kinase
MNENDKILSLVFIISGVVLTSFIAYIIFAVIKQQRQITKWQQARIEAEINTLENERKRIAGDLHDELGPMLSAIKLQVNHLEPTNPLEASLLEKSSTQIDNIIQRFREISYDLLPNTLVRKGFIKATEEYINKLKIVHPLKISFSYVEFSLASNNEINLYRVVQEIIQNTIKHARATVLHIEVIKFGKNILLETTDDGIGFDYKEKSLEKKGVGLLSLQSRAQLLGGQLIVVSQPGSGSIFKIEIPLTHEQ